MTDTIVLPTLTSEEVHVKMRQLRNARSRIAEEIATCEIDRAKLRAELDLVDEHQERVTKDDREYAARLERELEAHLLNLRAADDRVKSVRTPWGDVTSRVQQPEYKREEEMVLRWAEEQRVGDSKYRSPYINVKTVRTLDWERLKKACHVRDDNLVTADGEVVPGVTVIERGPKVVVETVE